ncbi:LamG domain-containing protein [Kitasatospora sp. NPDC001540]|uniref:LamG domain-containing protein n=1 Tax=Kitasatospora sp. NPDC001540 TaxID=3364014 RepID=UPI00369E9CE4
MTDGTHQPGGPAAQGPGPNPANAGAPQGGPPPGQFGAFGPPQTDAPAPGAAPQPDGYGYPHAAVPPPAYGYPQGPYGQQVPYGPPAFPAQQDPGAPDWEALAEEAAASSRRRRRLWTIGIVVVACLLGAGVGGVIIKNRGGHPEASSTSTASPGASGGPSGGASPSGNLPSDAPTVPGQPNLLADHSGQANLGVSPDAQVSQVQNGYVLRLRSNPNSYAQSTDPVVDVSKSFSISAWVYNEAGGVSRAAVSQGDGVSYSFLLGRDDTNGHKAWMFKVQTADGGADGTTVQVLSDNANTVGEWAQLTAVYDADQKSIALYVNGKLAGSAKVPGIWAGPGPLQIGRTRLHSQWGNYWAGVIGHIRIWNQAIPAEQIKGDGSAITAKPIASWLVG